MKHDRHRGKISVWMKTMPFLAIDSDGSPFPQIIEARLETFVLQARRLHHIMVSLPKEPVASKCAVFRENAATLSFARQPI